MNEVQTSLFEGPAVARRTDPITSKTAAYKVERTGKASSDRVKLFKTVKERPGLTYGELAILAGVKDESAHKRLPELRAKGSIRNGEARICSVRHSECQTWWPS